MRSLYEKGVWYEEASYYPFLRSYSWNFILQHQRTRQGRSTQAIRCEKHAQRTKSTKAHRSPTKNTLSAQTHPSTSSFKASV
jgi:hypothetical protein